MSVSKAFTAFLENIKVVNSGQINKRFGRITQQLNKYFYDIESKTSNSLQVGSYGRFTGLKIYPISICYSFFQMTAGQDLKIIHLIYCKW